MTHRRVLRPLRPLRHCALVAWLLTACAAPPLSLYSLDTSSFIATVPPLAGRPLVIEIARVSLPDEIDTEDMLVRDGVTLLRSSKGRWASRLSLQVTQLLAARLAQRRPDALVIDQSQPQPPAYRIRINISRLDVTVQGVATLEADWQMLPHDMGLPPRRQRGRFTATGPGASDPQMAALIGAVLTRLADAIDIADLQ